MPSTAAVVQRAVTVIVILLVGVAIEVYFLRTETGQRLDASSFGAVVALRALTGEWADRLRLVLPVLAAALAVAAAVIGIVRRRWRDLVWSAGVVLVALVASTVLKDFVVSRPDLGEYGYAENTFPSGHTAVTVAALIAFLWLVPRGGAALVVPLTVLGAAAALFQVASYAHRMSDVIGGALLAAAVAACRLSRPGSLRWSARIPLWLGVVILAIGGILCTVRWEEGGYATADQWTATAGIALLAASAIGAAMIIAAESRERSAERAVTAA